MGMYMYPPHWVLLIRCVTLRFADHENETAEFAPALDCGGDCPWLPVQPVLPRSTCAGVHHL
ncbi:Uncharacterised protein [Chlamydia trachomatis]|nr:Uncharacterised protein [Chlamydia trachomatis]